jgi:DNA polymerase-3 subunit epsilon
MNARIRFAISVLILGLLMTAPFVITALLIWVSAQAPEQALLVELILPHLSLGALMTIFGFALGLLLVRYLFREYVDGLLRMVENLHLMLSSNRNFRVAIEGPPEVRWRRRPTIWPNNAMA